MQNGSVLVNGATYSTLPVSTQQPTNNAVNIIHSSNNFHHISTKPIPEQPQPQPNMPTAPIMMSTHATPESQLLNIDFTVDFLNLNGKSVERVGNQLILYYNSQHQFLNIVTDVELQMDHNRIKTKELEITSLCLSAALVKKKRGSPVNSPHFDSNEYTALVRTRMREAALPAATIGRGTDTTFRFGEGKKSARLDVSLSDTSKNHSYRKNTRTFLKQCNKVGCECDGTKPMFLLFVLGLVGDDNKITDLVYKLSEPFILRSKREDPAKPRAVKRYRTNPNRITTVTVPGTMAIAQELPPIQMQMNTMTPQLPSPQQLALAFPQPNAQPFQIGSARTAFTPQQSRPASPTRHETLQANPIPPAPSTPTPVTAPIPSTAVQPIMQTQTTVQSQTAFERPPIPNTAPKLPENVSSQDKIMFDTIPSAQTQYSATQVSQYPAQAEWNCKPIADLLLPQPRAFHTVTALQNGDLVLYGGKSSETDFFVRYTAINNGLSSDIFILSRETSSWHNVAQPQPAQTATHSLSMSSPSLFSSSPHRPISSVPLFHLLAGSPVTSNTSGNFSHTNNGLFTSGYARVSLSGQSNLCSEAPIPRAKHSAVRTSRDHLIMFGGETSYGSTDELWLLEIQQPNSNSEPLYAGKWTKIQCSIGPSPRSGHTAVSTKVNGIECMIVFGGEDRERGTVNDTWLLYYRYSENNECIFEWVQYHSIEKPPPRFFHTATLCDENTSKASMVIYGGAFHDHCHKLQWRNDVWSFSLQHLQWNLLYEGLFVRSQHEPAARDGHLAVSLSPSKFIICGGWVGQRQLLALVASLQQTQTVNPLQMSFELLKNIKDCLYSSDLWVFDVDTRKWQVLPLHEDMVKGMCSGVAVPLPSDNTRFRFLLIGGESYPATSTKTVSEISAKLKQNRKRYLI